MTKVASRPARIVVAGAGLIGQAHIERILREPEARLAGIVDIDEKCAAQASALGVPYDTSIETMMGNARPDGIVIAVPNQAHFAAGMAAVDAGIAMLMEKPVCETVEQSMELAEAAERAGVPVLVGHHRRHSPIIRRAKEILASGGLGRIIAVNALCWLLKPPAYFQGQNSWRREPGGGPVMINLIHTIDDLRNLCGDIATVQAMTSRQARGFSVEDTAGVILGFRNGAIGTLALSDAAAGPWSWELTAGENRAYPRTAESCYYIAGAEGALSIPASKSGITVGTAIGGRRSMPSAAACPSRMRIASNQATIRSRTRCATSATSRGGRRSRCLMLEAARERCKRRWRSTRRPVAGRWYGSLEWGGTGTYSLLYGEMYEEDSEYR